MRYIPPCIGFKPGRTDQIDHALYHVYMKQSYDVGGERDAQVIYEEKEEEEEHWDLNFFVDYEVLGAGRI